MKKGIETSELVNISELSEKVNKVSSMKELTELLNELEIPYEDLGRELSEDFMFCPNEYMRLFIARVTPSATILERMAFNDAAYGIRTTAMIRLMLMDIEEMVGMDTSFCYMYVSDFTDFDNTELLTKETVSQDSTGLEKIISFEKEVSEVGEEDIPALVDKHGLGTLNRRESEMLMFHERFGVRFYVASNTSSAYVLKSMLYGANELVIKKIAEIRLRLMDFLKYVLGITEYEGLESFLSVTED